MGTRKRERQPTIWVAARSLASPCKARTRATTRRFHKTLPETAEQLEAVAAVTDHLVVVIEELVGDKRYHSRTTTEWGFYQPQCGCAMASPIALTSQACQWPLEGRRSA